MKKIVISESDRNEILNQYIGIYIDLGKNDTDLDQILNRKNVFLCINDQLDYSNQCCFLLPMW